jgi:hypothetical protein
MSRQAIAEAIHQQLIADRTAGSLWSLLDGRIYHLHAPPDTALPLATVRIDEDKPQTFFDGSSDICVEVEVEIRAGDASTLLAADDRLFDCLQHQSLTVDGCRRATMRVIERGRTKADRDLMKSTSRWILIATTR